ncbi:MAG: hypothetical protein ACI9JK_001293 [Phycisphaerales bacterium]|jgi:hypothetical protein
MLPQPSAESRCKVARELTAIKLKPNPYYTDEKLISKCQEAMDKYGLSVKLVYVYLDNNHTIGHKFKTPKSNPRAWTLLESGGALAYVDCSKRPRNGTLPAKVLELLRWLIYSNPNESANLAECASYLAAMSSMATQVPLQTRKGKEAFVCSEDGKPFVYFDSREPQNELITKCITKTTGDDNALKHFEKYPDCQWIMVWDDILGAIQMAARDHTLTNEIGDSSENKSVKQVNKIGGWTKKEIVEHVKHKTGCWSASSFVNVRKNSMVVASEPNGKGQQRRYADDEIEELALTVEDKKNSFRDGVKIASALRDLLLSD